MKSRILRTFFTMTALSVLANAAAFTAGDVFASIGNGLVKEFTPTGTLVQTLDTTRGTGVFTTGSAFDSSGNLYVTDFNSNAVSKFNNSGVVQGTFGSGYSTNEDIRVDASGNVFVGNLDGPGLLKFNSSGAPLGSFAAGARIDWFDLNASQTTMYYTDESGTIHRWDLATNTAMSNLGAGGAFALRLLGDGTILAADGSQVSRIDIATGTTIQTYHPGGTELFALNLDPDGTTFWTGDIISGQIWRVNIATGALVTTFNSAPSSQLAGLSIFGEITQVGPPPPGVPEPASIMLLASGLAFVGSVVRWRAR